MHSTLQAVVLTRTPQGVPQVGDFSLSEQPLPEPAAGEVLCETLYLSLDPYMRSQMAGRHLSGGVAPGEVPNGETVSRVLISRSEAVREGTLVRCFGGWRSHSLHRAEALWPLPENFPEPSLALSTLGMPGLTAWAGLQKAQPAAGETVLVSAATGGVGAVAGQLARARGARVVGIAGGPEKCRIACERLGYEQCIDRHRGELREQLREACPEGVEVYFDLVGGELLTAASEQLRSGARVLLCGLMAQYNSEDRPAGPPPGLWIRARATVYGLVVYDFEPQRDAFLAEALPVYRAGRLKPFEDRSAGLASAPEAFCRLMRGENRGKALVCVAEHTDAAVS
jgi:NADPH-dependent curcumin reductase CurA